jgi:hypothetical protein
MSSVNWNIVSDGGGTCQDCSTNAGYTIGTQCSAVADSASSGAIADGENPNINAQTYSFSKSNAGSAFAPLFNVNYGSPPSSLVVITYATSGGQEGTLSTDSFLCAVTLGNSDIGYIGGSDPTYGCALTQNQESTTPFLSSTHYNDVYIDACGNIPYDGSGAWCGPSISVGSSTSVTYVVYVFNPDAPSGVTPATLTT